MKATLAVEYIGEAQDARMALYAGIMDQLAPGVGRAVVGGSPRIRKPWAAEITATHPTYGFERRFLPANWQRKRANSTHSRGVELWFVLETGKVYEVKAPASWRNSDRYFCRVTEAGDIVRITKEDVEQWLRCQSGSMC